MPRVASLNRPKKLGPDPSDGETQDNRTIWRSQICSWRWSLLFAPVKEAGGNAFRKDLLGWLSAR